ncbi:MAG: RNase adapter RapZ [Elusimicrobia bacterium]|nr:RNase adapter RapZ [Elusimicrobiota bacterium]
MSVKKSGKLLTAPQGSDPIIIVTGVSGAGKSQALKVLEDFGFFCVDNLPTSLVKNFLGILNRSACRPMTKVALGIDIRAQSFLDELPKVLEEFRLVGLNYRILFLDSSEEVLLRRFSETRHRHPLSSRALHDAIKTERSQMVMVKETADKVIDTSSLTLGELKEAISAFLGVRHEREMNLAIVSFGYKFGLPIDADLIWDVRFLPNPNYLANLKPLTGLDVQVERYVLGNPKATARLDTSIYYGGEILPYRGNRLHRRTPPQYCHRPCLGGRTAPRRLSRQGVSPGHGQMKR